MSGLSAPPNGRGRPTNYSREERERLGLPVCYLTPGCPRSPSKGRKGCPECRTATARTRRQRMEGPVSDLKFRVTVALAGQVALRAQSEGISASEWIRRALARELAQTPPSSGS